MKKPPEAAGKEVTRVAELTYSVTEAANALGISRRSMYDLLHREGFPTLKVGGRRLISKELLAQWVKDQAEKNQLKQTIRPGT